MAASSSRPRVRSALLAAAAAAALAGGCGGSDDEGDDFDQERFLDTSYRVFDECSDRRRVLRRVGDRALRRGRKPPEDLKRPVSARFRADVSYLIEQLEQHRDVKLENREPGQDDTVEAVVDSLAHRIAGTGRWYFDCAGGDAHDEAARLERALDER